MNDFIRQQIGILRQHTKGDLAKNMCIGVLLAEYLAAHPLNPQDDFDLNPHLSIKHYCEEVASQVILEGFECTDSDVMLMWLTDAIYTHNIKV